jgi:hypothetical protein
VELIVFEQDKAYVQRSLESGEIDYMEVASEGAETEFFHYINSRGILERLADTYPLKKKKSEVPLWLYIASDLSLRLHGMQSFHGYPLVIRTGGLLNALGPKVGRKVLHPETDQMTIHCPGFNQKNHYDRETPCDQDFLRKTARSTSAQALMGWYNTEVPRLLKAHALFDPEGIFIGDASYVFVPDNENYEGSVVMLFDRHNRPVEKQKLTPGELRSCRLRRCYKWVELIHTNRAGEFFFFVGMHFGSGKPHEGPILYGLVEEFLRVVGPGVMKWLILDRGFLDGERIGHLKTDWNVDTLSGLRSDMNILEDARGLLELGSVAWQDYRPPKPPPPIRAKPESLIRREEARERMLKAQGRWPQEAPPERVVVFTDLTSWESCTVPLSVVLTQRPDKPPWGLVTTAHTQDGPFLRDRYQLRETIEERHRQTKLFWDLSGFHSPNFNLVTHQVVFVGLAYTLLQMQLLCENRPELNRMTRRTLQHQMLPYGNHIIVYRGGYFGFFDLPEYTEIIMGITKPAKSKLLRKVRRLRRDFLTTMNHPRPP